MAAGFRELECSWVTPANDRPGGEQAWRIDQTRSAAGDDLVNRSDQECSWVTTDDPVDRSGWSAIGRRACGSIGAIRAGCARVDRVASWATCAHGWGGTSGRGGGGDGRGRIDSGGDEELAGGGLILVADDGESRSGFEL